MSGEDTGLCEVWGWVPTCLGHLRQVWRAAFAAGWPITMKLLLTLLSSPQGDPTGGPALPSATTFFCLLCYPVQNVTTAQELCTSLLAGQAFGYPRACAAERLCSDGCPWADAAGRAVGNRGRCPVHHLPGHPTQPSLCAHLFPPLLLSLHPALGKDNTYVPALQGAFRPSPAHDESRR